MSSTAAMTTDVMTGVKVANTRTEEITVGTTDKVEAVATQAPNI